MIGQLFQIITSAEIPSWRRPQNYKVWQLESQRGRENDEDEKNNKLSWSPRAAIWIAALLLGWLAHKCFSSLKSPNPMHSHKSCMCSHTHMQLHNILINGRLTYSNHSPFRWFHVVITTLPKRPTNTMSQAQAETHKNPPLSVM